MACGTMKEIQSPTRTGYTARHVSRDMLQSNVKTNLILTTTS